MASATPHLDLTAGVTRNDTFVVEIVRNSHRPELDDWNVHLRKIDLAGRYVTPQDIRFGRWFAPARRQGRSAERQHREQHPTCPGAFIAMPCRGPPSRSNRSPVNRTRVSGPLLSICQAGRTVIIALSPSSVHRNETSRLHVRTLPDDIDRRSHVGTKNRENIGARPLMTGTRLLVPHLARRGGCRSLPTRDVSASTAAGGNVRIISVAISVPPNPDGLVVAGRRAAYVSNRERERSIRFADISIHVTGPLRAT